tara:strand:+ start:162 stop:497 length:336 start_codon:yes stop_codon:yes gene_type:complete
MSVVIKKGFAALRYLNDGRLIIPEEIIAIPAIIKPPKSARPLRNLALLIILPIIIHTTINAVHPIRKNPLRLVRNEIPVPLLSACAIISLKDTATKRNTDVKITDANMTNL